MNTNPENKSDKFASIRKQGSEPASENAPIITVNKASFDATTWKVAMTGTILGLILFLISFTHFIFSYFNILTHELGHAMFSWMFGRFAIPLFDFMFGGGMTMIYDRAPGFTVVMAIVFIIVAFFSLRNFFRLAWLIVFAAVYFTIILTGADEALGIFMGHGSELIFVGIFLYRGISSFACQYEAERYVYIMLAAFMLFNDISFANGLLFDPSKVSEYMEGKGGIVDNDFVRVANEYWHVKLSTVVGFYYFLTLITPVITVLAYRYREWWWRMLARFISRDGRL
jgi:hypothetical protein